MRRKSGTVRAAGFGVMLAALLALLITATPGSSAAQTVIRVWTPWPSYADIFETLKTEFHKLHPDITVQTTEMPESEDRAAVKSALAANAGPDIITAVPGRTGMNFFADAGALVDLTPYYEKFHWADNYPDWITKDLTYTTKSGHKGMWVVPTHIASLFLFYDPSFFADHHLDVPKTFDQFLGYCKAANAAGVIPLAFGDGGGGWMGVEYISYLLDQTAGSSGVDALVNGKGSWSAPDAVKARAGAGADGRRQMLPARRGVHPGADRAGVMDGRQGGHALCRRLVVRRRAAAEPGPVWPDETAGRSADQRERADEARIRAG